MSDVSVGGKPVTGCDKPGTITQHEIRFILTDAEQAQAANCLKTNKKITIKFHEIEVTKLPVALDNGRVID